MAGNEVTVPAQPHTLFCGRLFLLLADTRHVNQCAYLNYPISWSISFWVLIWLLVCCWLIRMSITLYLVLHLLFLSPQLLTKVQWRFYGSFDVHKTLWFFMTCAHEVLICVVNKFEKSYRPGPFMASGIKMSSLNTDTRQSFR